MVQSVELLLEPGAEREVLAVWRALADAGLPSQAHHTAPSNRPHVTLVAVPEIDPVAEAAVTSAAAEVALPLAATWGEVHLFGHRPHAPQVLVRLVHPGEALRRVQARLAAATGVTDDSLSAPSRWTAHVTLARRVAEDDVDRAVELARATFARTAPEGTPVATAAVRRWDSERKREWTLPGAQP